MWPKQEDEEGKGCEMLLKCYNALVMCVQKDEGSPDHLESARWLAHIFQNTSTCAGDCSEAHRVCCNSLLASQQAP